MAGTEEELTMLREDKVPRDRLIWTTYFFSHFFAEQPERIAFRDAMQAAGFTALGADEEATGDGYWHYWSNTIRSADPDQLRAADRTASTIADAHGVRYDEWTIKRIGDGQLRPASADDVARIHAADLSQRQAAARFAARTKRRPS